MTTLQQKPAEAAAPQPVARPRRAAALRPHVVTAVFRRDFLGYFSNPAGYVFIGLFVLVCSLAEFWQPAFFANNLANLDPLNRLMPYILLFFIPAITMTTWAEERKQGTEELLLTLPARDVEVVLGKYLAALGIFAVALGFLAIGQVALLRWLGRPDWGILAATFLGYLLMGAMMIAIGMVASLLSANVTVAFILGAVFCALPVYTELLGTATAGAARRLVESLSVPAQFRDFGTGAVPLAGIVYFVSLAAGMLYLNMVLLGRRHWAGGEENANRWAHALARVLAVVVALVSLDVLVGQWLNARVDATEERLHTLSPASAKLVRGLAADKPVSVHAFYSPEVPREYVQVKADLINKLKEYAALAGNKIRLELVPTERYSEAARRAEKQFGIAAKAVRTIDEARQATQEIYLGVAFTCGPEEVVVPFFDRGLPVEYELTRSIRVVSGTRRKKVGILNTDAKLMGGMDFRSFSPESEWQIVTELKKQYDVSQVSADNDLPADLDALVVAQPSSLSQPQIDRLTTYIRRGGPALLLLDPLPVTVGDPSLAPTEQKMPAGGMFGGGPPPEPKGDLRPLLDLIGLEWPATEIVWNPYNPHPQLGLTEPEIVFVGRGSGAREPFAADPITAGLQEVVLLFPGFLQGRTAGGTTQFAPLLRTNDLGGTVAYNQTIQRGILGMSGLNRTRPHFATDRAYTLAARITGPLASGPEPAGAEAKDQAKAQSKPAEARVIAIADLDMISDTFFEIRRRPVETMDFLDFDNVTFVLNCIDVLAGDDSFLDLRKKRPHHRTLLRVEAQTEDFVKKSQAADRKAEDTAKRQLDEIQKRLDEEVEKIRNSKEYDERTKASLVEFRLEVNRRKLDVARAEVEDQKRQKVAESKSEEQAQIQAIENRIRAAAVILPPIPALLLGAIIFAVRAGRENRGASPNRLA